MAGIRAKTAATGMAAARAIRIANTRAVITLAVTQVAVTQADVTVMGETIATMIGRRVRTGATTTTGILHAIARRMMTKARGAPAIATRVRISVKEIAAINT